MMKNFKLTEKLKELYSEHPYTHPDSIIATIFLYFLYYISCHQFIHPPILGFLYSEAS